MDRNSKVLTCGSSKVWVTAQMPSSVFFVPLCETIKENGRSEVTSANRYWGSDTSVTNSPVLGQQYAYSYDPIGNRISGGRASSQAAYDSNELNQYVSRTVPDTVSIIGSAPANVDVSVNGVAVDRQGTYWHSIVTVNNVPSPVYAEIEILGVLEPANQNDPPEYSISTNHLFVAQSPEVFEYDLDGNLTKDGRFVYSWNGENRLICVETRNDLPIEVPRYKVEYAYDYMGRMISKEVSDPTSNSQLETKNFLWDNWNLISETSVSSTPHSSLLTTNSISYVWGIDLSGSLQGAGGVGGLLAVVRDDGVFTPTYDANGNISEYIDAQGNIVAHYEYDVFGNIVVQCGDWADTLSFRFSTKPYCDITGISHYEKRPYSFGRFLSRDPIGERGGSNLYGFCGNNPVNSMDALGEEIIDNVDKKGLDDDAYVKVIYPFYVEYCYPNAKNIPDWAQLEPKYQKAYRDGILDKMRGLHNVTITAALSCDNDCGERSGCLCPVVKKDTTLGGFVYWSASRENTKLPKYKTISTAKGHEMHHFGITKEVANDVDTLLHGLADKKCVTSDCCNAKVSYFDKYLEAAQARQLSLNADFDFQEYGGGGNRTARKADYDRLKADADRLKGEMDRICGGQ